MSEVDPIHIEETRRVGIEVDIGNGPVRPIWRRITIDIPDGEITAAAWDSMSHSERRDFVEGNEHE